jgi:hypothetical protein
MDKLHKCIRELRPSAQHPDNLNGLPLAEERVNEYLQHEVAALRASLERLDRAIDTEAAKNVRGEDWSLIRAYVQSCLYKLPDAAEG